MAWQSGLKEAGPYLGLGVQLAGTMVFWVIGGYLLDWWLSTTPWFTIAGGVVGMVAFFFQMMRLLKKMELDNAEQKRRRKSEAD